MKKTTLALAVAIASITSVANAALPENTFYIGGKLGWSKYYDTNSERISGTNKVHDSRFGAGAFVGFQANPYIAAEIGYDYLGKLSYTGSSAGKSELTLQGVSFTGKASYPLSFIDDNLDIYARAGAFIHVTKWKTPGENYSSQTDISPTYAVGFDYRISDDFSTRLEYQWINHIGNSGPIHPDNAFLSLGLTYSLGSPNVPKASEFEYRENRYVLSEDVLFGFGNADLKAEGQAALNDLVSTLTKLNASESAVVVIGHADRIGSDSYNQKLSEQRAQVVLDYLVSKGVPSNIITARGVGKSQSVTGDQCNALKGADLRACLAPDRRVVIEVKAKTVEEVEILEQKDNTK